MVKEETNKIGFRLRLLGHLLHLNIHIWGQVYTHIFKKKQEVKLEHFGLVLWKDSGLDISVATF